MPSDPFVSPEWTAPMEPAPLRELYVSQPPQWQGGTPALPRPRSAASDTGVLALVLAILVFVAFNARHLRRLAAHLPQDLWSLRRRNNAFDDHTANETRTILLLILQLCVFEAVMAWMWLGAPLQRWDFRPVFPAVGLLVGVMAAWYVFSLTAYYTLGYVFSDRQGRAHFVRGFNASQVLLSMALTPVALICLFYPALAPAMLYVAAALYLLTRGAFVAKGFRIFYHHFPSLLYFILYLCTLEIIPVAAIAVLATEICVTL